ncbi:uncharacterized protein PAC_09521 [Phialocephala subalpina]|uniref:Uncharacterized protein n=1 Tax=Phialocephala subalpina TaxID=576137 RepID=A0A1L7X3R3_9HELO|nr:uncharacterized protein PAC_09521 [Phialocephala subalpina]
MADKEKQTSTMSVRTQSAFSLNIGSAEDIPAGCASSSSTVTTTIKSSNSTTTTVIRTSHTYTGRIPQELNKLINELHNFFKLHHPRILDIYSLINKLNVVIAKTERIDKANKALKNEVEHDESVEQITSVGDKMRALDKERDDIDKETMKIIERWNDAMCWVEEDKVMHEMKSCEGWMKAD